LVEVLDEQVGRLPNGVRRYANVDLLANFLDTHDMERAQRRCGFDPMRLRNALAFILFARGVPVVYYGTEQSFGHADARASLWQTGYSTVEPMYLFLARLNRLRREQLPGAAVRRTRVIAYNESYLVFSRVAAEGDTTAGGGEGDARIGDVADRVVVFVNSRPGNDRTYWSSPRTTYCTDTPAEAILPPPPEGFVWADAVSGWTASRSVSQCLEAPNGFPKVMRLLHVENATSAAASIYAEDNAAILARWPPKGEDGKAKR